MAHGMMEIESLHTIIPESIVCESETDEGA